MKRVSKTKQLLLYAGPFPALAFFKVWASSGPTAASLTVVALLMLACCAGVIFLAHRWDKPTYFDWAIAAYFALVSFSLIAWPRSASWLLSRYPVTGIYVCLFAAAFFPPLVGMDPFTYHYAKKYTPAVVWNNPVFILINRIMTYVWAGIFAISIAVSLYPSVITRALIPLGLILGFGLPFNFRFPEFYLKRLGLPTLAEQRRMAGEDDIGSPMRMGDLFDRTSCSSGADASVQVGSDSPPEKKVKDSSIGAEDIRSQRKENAMQILALNSSPRGGGQSKTRLMLDHLVQGMREAGAQVELVDLCKKTIRNCVGCFTCWTKTPGVCIHKDDMTKDLFPKFLESDLVVYATPLYHFTLNATLKAFIERTLPILQPLFEQAGGKTHHPLRQEFPKAVFLSVAGFPEMSVFGQLSSWVHFVFGNGRTLVAEIYRPAAEAMTVPFFKDKAQDILEATRQAGREIVGSLKISGETLARITQDLNENKELFGKIGNLFWKTCIAEGITPKEFDERGLIPRPDSVETFMIILSMGFHSDGAGDTRALLQFNFSGEVEGKCHFRIENRQIKAVSGSAENPDLIIDTPFDVWMDIMTGKADGQQMFMAQKYQVKGDLSLLMGMSKMFGK
jgi:multimeric flavodoxin WrbA